jgi:membrane protein required for colicin V production
LNTLDLIILIIVLIPALIGMKYGFLRSVFSLVSILLGLYLATKFHSGFALILHKVIKDEKILNVVSFIIIISVIYVAGVFIASKISKFNIITKTIDRLLGLLFGILKGLIVVSLILIVSRSFDFIPETKTKSSLFYPYVYDVAPKTFDAITTFIPISKKSFDDLNPLMKKDTTIRK